MTTAMQTTDPAAIVPADPPGVNPLVLIQTAMERGIDAEQLSKLMDLQERWEKGEAAKKFAAALARFQAECPPVRKGRTADAGRMKYQFAGLDDVLRTISPHLARNQIVVTFPHTEPTEFGLRVVCRVRVGTHYEDTPLTLPIPVMSVNDTQKVGAALSYGKRYSVVAALNIQVTDEDDDAAGLAPQQPAARPRRAPDDHADAAEIARLFDALRLDGDARFWEYIGRMQSGCKRLEDLNPRHYPAVLGALRANAQKNGVQS